MVSFLLTFLFSDKRSSRAAIYLPTQLSESLMIKMVITDTMDIMVVMVIMVMISMVVMVVMVDMVNMIIMVVMVIMVAMDIMVAMNVTEGGL